MVPTAEHSLYHLRKWRYVSGVGKTVIPTLNLEAVAPPYSQFPDRHFPGFPPGIRSIHPHKGVMTTRRNPKQKPRWSCFWPREEREAPHLARDAAEVVQVVLGRPADGHEKLRESRVAE